MHRAADESYLDILSAPLAIRTRSLSATGSSKWRPVFRCAIRVANSWKAAQARRVV
jgi:hypothetical protein